MKARELIFVGAAGLLHLGVLSLALVAPRGHGPVATEPLRAIEIELAPAIAPPLQEAPRPEPPRTDPPIPPEAPPPEVAPSVIPPTSPRVAPTDVPPTATAAPTSEPAGGPAAPPTTAPTPSGGGDEYGGPVARLPGVPGAPAWSLPGVMPNPGASLPAPTTSPRAPAVDRDKAGKLLRGSMAERDHGLGLDLPGAGTIAAAVAGGVRSSGTPEECRSSFVVRLSGSGRVTEVRALRWSTGDADAFHRAAQAAAAQLAANTLVMGGYAASGALVYVDIVSLLTLPSGGDGPTRKGLTLGFDVADVGSKPRRVVRSSYRITPG